MSHNRGEATNANPASRSRTSQVKTHSLSIRVHRYARRVERAIDTAGQVAFDATTNFPVRTTSARRFSTCPGVSPTGVILTTAIMCKSLFRARSPSRFNQGRTVLPEDAGIGFAPARETNAAVLRTMPSCDHTAGLFAALIVLNPGLPPGDRPGSSPPCPFPVQQLRLHASSERLRGRVAKTVTHIPSEAVSSQWPRFSLNP